MQQGIFDLMLTGEGRRRAFWDKLSNLSGDVPGSSSVTVQVQEDSWEKERIGARELGNLRSHPSFSADWPCDCELDMHRSLVLILLPASRYQPWQAMAWRLDVVLLIWPWALA